MKFRREDADRALAAAIDDLDGKRVWGPEVGVGSFITVNFGGSRKNSGGLIIGEYHLWVYGGSWILSRRSVNLATSSDSRALMERAVARLDGLTVTGAEFAPADPSLTIRFSGGLGLQVEPTPEPDMEHWVLYLPDGFVVSSGPGGVLVYESASG